MSEQSLSSGGERREYASRSVLQILEARIKKLVDASGATPSYPPHIPTLTLWNGTAEETRPFSPKGGVPSTVIRIPHEVVEQVAPDAAAALEIDIVKIVSHQAHYSHRGDIAVPDDLDDILAKNVYSSEGFIEIDLVHALTSACEETALVLGTRPGETREGRPTDEDAGSTDTLGGVTAESYEAAEAIVTGLEQMTPEQLLGAVVMYTQQ